MIFRRLTRISSIPEELLNFNDLVGIYSRQSEIKINLLGETRRLEVRPIGSKNSNNQHWICSNHSVIFGDVRLLKRAAREIANRVRPFHPEILLTAESKGILLTGLVAEVLELDSIEVCRKDIKAYNRDVLSVEIDSTISGRERLILDHSSIQNLKGKRIGIVDDVVATGANIIGMNKLALLAGGKPVVNACIWVEGVPRAKDALMIRRDLIYLALLPEFFSKYQLKNVEKRFALLTSGRE